MSDVSVALPESEGAVSSAEQELSVSAESAEYTSDENVIALAETSSAPEESAESEPFLAVTIGALSFGTNSIPFASGIALAILSLLGYGLYWINPGNLFRKW